MKTHTKKSNSSVESGTIQVEGIAESLGWAVSPRYVQDLGHPDTDVKFYSFVHGYVYGLDRITTGLLGNQYLSEVAAIKGRSGGLRRSTKKARANQANSARGVKARQVRREERREKLQAIVNENGLLPVKELTAFLPPEYEASPDTVGKDLREMGLR